ncbi:MAG: fasciclin domain-containing protein [Flavobacteriales bacterium]
MKTTLKIATVLLATGLALHATAQDHMGTMDKKEKTLMVGGAEMYPSKNIIENAVNSKDHTTLVAAVKAAGLVPTLESKGPFTVFAPTNKAFGALPSGTVDNLLKPENKDKLTKVLTYHVLPGKFDSKAVMAAIKAGDGKVSMKTVEGDMLTFKMNGKNLEVWDENGGHATVTTADVYQSNGVIHVVDSVLLPKM